MGYRTATIRDMDPKHNLTLRLDNMDCLNMYHQVMWHKTLQPDGTVVENPDKYMAMADEPHRLNVKSGNSA
jgi:hypothetical protein